MLKEKYKNLIFLACAIYFVLPAAANAATMEISPEYTVLQAGQNITLKVVTQSSEPINAVTANMSFQSDVLSVTSISKADSAFTLWVQEPKFSNTSGTINFSGIVPDPGVSDRALVLVVNMRAKRAGTAVIRFDTAAVLANDGQGTNIITGTVPATITVTPAPTTPKPAPTTSTAPTPTVQEIPTPTPTPELPIFEPPVITKYQSASRIHEPVAIVGTSKYAGKSIAIHFSSGTNEITGNAQTDSSGNFIYVEQNGLESGKYNVYAIVQDWNGKSNKSNVVHMQVAQEDGVLIIGRSVSVSFIFTSLILLSVFLILLGTYTYVRVRWLKQRLDRDLHDVEESLYDATQKIKRNASGPRLKTALEEVRTLIEKTLSELHEDI